MSPTLEDRPLRRLRHAMTEAGRNPVGAAHEALKGKVSQPRITQTVLADMLGVSRDMIAKVEAGDRDLSERTAATVFEKTGAVLFPHALSPGVNMKGVSLEIKPGKDQLLTETGEEYTQEVYERILMKTFGLPLAGGQGVTSQERNPFKRSDISRAWESENLLLRMRALLDAADRCNSWESVFQEMFRAMLKTRAEHVDDESLEEALRSVEKSLNRFEVEELPQKLGIDVEALRSDLESYRAVEGDESLPEEQRQFAKDSARELESQLDEIEGMQRLIQKEEGVKTKMKLPVTWPNFGASPEPYEREAEFCVEISTKDSRNRGTPPRQVDFVGKKKKE